MKTAYLTSWFNESENKKGYVWQNIKEQDISKNFKTVNEAMDNKPSDYNNFIKI